MEFMTWVSSLLFSALLGAVVGFGLITRKVLLAWNHFVILVLLFIGMGYISTYLGSWLGEFIPFRFMEVVVGLLVIACGAYFLKVKPLYPGYLDILIFYALLVIEVCLLGYRAGHAQQGGLGIVLLLACVHFAGLLCGMYMGGKRVGNWRVIMFLPHLPGACLVILGLFQVF